MNQGFSMTEVLVALVLVSTISLSLLKQQWQQQQLFYQLNLQQLALYQLDNTSEEVMSGCPPTLLPHPFELRATTFAHQTELLLLWSVPVAKSRKAFRLSRQICLA